MLDLKITPVSLITGTAGYDRSVGKDKRHNPFRTLIDGLFVFSSILAPDGPDLIFFES
jgi:hypothetical protein